MLGLEQKPSSLGLWHVECNIPLVSTAFTWPFRHHLQATSDAAVTNDLNIFQIRPVIPKGR